MSIFPTGGHNGVLLIYERTKTTKEGSWISLVEEGNWILPSSVGCSHPTIWRGGRRTGRRAQSSSAHGAATTSKGRSRPQAPRAQAWGVRPKHSVYFSTLVYTYATVYKDGSRRPTGLAPPLTISMADGWTRALPCLQGQSRTAHRHSIGRARRDGECASVVWGSVAHQPSYLMQQSSYKGGARGTGG